jgi:hypothetical protein
MPGRSSKYAKQAELAALDSGTASDSVIDQLAPAEVERIQQVEAQPATAFSRGQGTVVARRSTVP